MKAAKSGHFMSGKLRLHYLDWGGSGVPLILLHGGSAHAHWWDFVARHLSDSFRVYALDFRGHGDSEWAGDGVYRIEDYASDVGRMIDALGLGRPVLVGHSFGAFVALHYAVGHSRSLRALVLVDARASLAPAGSRYLQLLKILAPGEYATLEEAVEKFRPLPKETSAEPRVLEYVARRSFRPDGNGRWVTKFDRNSLAAHSPFDLRGDLRKIECPVLFVRGEKSRILPRAAAVDLAGRCRAGTWVEVSGAHHHVLLDRPEALTEEIRKFLVRRRC